MYDLLATDEDDKLGELHLKDWAVEVRKVSQ